MSTNELIKNIFQDIYDITGIKAALFDADMICLYTQPGGFGAFCQCLRRSQDHCRSCLQYDRECFAECRATGEPVIRPCYMGLIETAIPIRDGELTVGYLQMGPLLPEKTRSQLRERVMKLSHPYKEELLRDLEEMTETRESVIRASARLLRMCADYIKFRDILQMRQESLELRIRHYVVSYHSDPNLSMKNMCRDLGISRGTLYNISKNAFGMGITEYIRQVRIRKAMELLQRGGMSVSRVAEAVGISDANYLTKLIKKHTGLTPKKLQKTQQ